MDVIDLIAADDDDDGEPINLLDSDDERTVQNQPSSTTIPSSKNASQHTNKSALRNLRYPSSRGNQKTAQANRSSAWSEPVQQPSPSKGLPLGSGQQARAGSEAPAHQPGTASKALHQHSIVSADVKATLASGSFDAKSTLPSASTAAQPSLPPLAATPLATLRQQQQQPAAPQVASTQPISTHTAASSQQQARPSDDDQPAVSSPGRGPQHPPPLLRNIHAQRQAAAKTDGQVAQQTALAAQQPAQVHSASPMEQMAWQVIASRQAAQNQGTKGDCLHHAKVRQSS